MSDPRDDRLDRQIDTYFEAERAVPLRPLSEFKLRAARARAAEMAGTADRWRLWKLGTGVALAALVVFLSVPRHESVTNDQLADRLEWLVEADQDSFSETSDPLVRLDQEIRRIDSPSGRTGKKSGDRSRMDWIFLDEQG